MSRDRLALIVGDSHLRHHLDIEVEKKDWRVAHSGSDSTTLALLRDPHRYIDGADTVLVDAGVVDFENVVREAELQGMALIVVGFPKDLGPKKGLIPPSAKVIEKKGLWWSRIPGPDQDDL